MRKSTQLLVAGLAGCGLLLTACEVPGGGQPPRTIVFPNPEGTTPFSGFPATFKGTNVLTSQSDQQEGGSGLFGLYDEYSVQIDDEVTIEIDCEVFDEGTYVYVDSSLDVDENFDCSEGGGTITVAGYVDIEIWYYGDVPGLHPYVIHANYGPT